MEIKSPQLLAAVLCGGLAGAVFTWFINRPKPTVVTYGVTTTTIGTDDTVKGLVPNLKIQIGSEEVPVIHTHVLEFAAQSGPYVERAELGIAFSRRVRLFGKILAQGPSPVHGISCRELETGAICTISPLAPGSGTFRVSMAVNQKEIPTLTMAARNTELMKYEEFLQREGRLPRVFWLAGVGAIAGLVIGALGYGLGLHLIDLEKRLQQRAK
jgi:hypothetical protein